MGGTAALGTQSINVELRAPNNTVGGGLAGAQNRIAFGATGVRVLNNTSTGNRIQQNSIFSNTSIGIDLSPPAGTTNNDAGDSDTGPNNLQNFPEMTTATLSGGNLTINYSVPSSLANSAYPLRVEFFEADGTARQGKTFLGAENYAAAIPDSITVAAGSVVAGDRIVATATDNNGNTSEFSATIVVAGSLMAASSASPAPGADSPSSGIAAAAVARLSAGLNERERLPLFSAQFTIADLPGSIDDERFLPSAPRDLRSVDDRADRRPDFFAAVLPELGADTDDLLAELIRPGIRRTGLADAIEALFASE